MFSSDPGMPASGTDTSSLTREMLDWVEEYCETLTVKQLLALSDHLRERARKLDEAMESTVTYQDFEKAHKDLDGDNEEGEEY